MLLKRLAIGLAAVLATILPAKAESALDTIIQRGTINVGVGLGTPPYGLMDSSMQPDGYDVSVAKLIARDLGVKANIVDTTAANRIPNLTSGKLDIVIYSFSITAERAKAILANWDQYVPKFVKVMPKDYKRMLACINRAQASGLTGDEAIMSAFEENARDLSRVGGN